MSIVAAAGFAGTTGAAGIADAKATNNNAINKDTMYSFIIVFLNKLLCF